MTFSPNLSFTWTTSDWQSQLMLKRFKECEEKGICFWCGKRKNLNEEKEKGK